MSTESNRTLHWIWIIALVIWAMYTALSLQAAHDWIKDLQRRVGQVETLN